MLNTKLVKTADKVQPNRQDIIYFSTWESSGVIDNRNRISKLYKYLSENPHDTSSESIASVELIVKIYAKFCTQISDYVDNGKQFENYEENLETLYNDLKLLYDKLTRLWDILENRKTAQLLLITVDNTQEILKKSITITMNLLEKIANNSKNHDLKSYFSILLLTTPFRTGEE